MNAGVVLRAIFKAATAGLLLLCVGLWIGSAWWTLNWGSPGGLYVGIDSGRLWCSVYGSFAQAERPRLWFFYQHSFRLHLWFDWEQRGAWKYVWVPAWVLLFPAMAGLIAVWKWDARRCPFAMAGHCAKCGYDLSVTGDRCPECGTAK